VIIRDPGLAPAQTRPADTEAASGDLTVVGGQSTAAAIRSAALDAFYALGYHGTSTREISRAAGIGVATLYHHYGSKQDILVDLVEGFFAELLERTTRAADAARPDVAAQLGAIVEEHVLFHIAHRVQGFVAYADFRSLPAPHRERARERRRAEQTLIEGVIRRGVRAKLFGVDRPGDASLGLVQMCSAVLSWYRVDGRFTPEDIAGIYVELAMNLVRAA